MTSNPRAPRKVIFNADCIDVMRSFDTGAVDFILTDPPYVTRFLRYEHEQAYLLAKGNPARPEHPIPDVLDFPYTGNKLHPTQKPVEALRPLIEAFTKPGDLVLDPFCGSGSSRRLLACSLPAGSRGLPLSRSRRRAALARIRSIGGFPQKWRCSRASSNTHGSRRWSG